jgi:hypothetical protein
MFVSLIGGAYAISRSEHVGDKICVGILAGLSVLAVLIASSGHLQRSMGWQAVAATLGGGVALMAFGRIGLALAIPLALIATNSFVAIIQIRRALRFEKTQGGVEQGRQ